MGTSELHSHFVVVNSICTHLDAKERPKVLIRVNSNLEARQVVVIQPLVSNVKIKLLDEKGIEVRGCRITKAGGFLIGFRGSDIKVEVVENIQLSNSNVKVKLINEQGFEIKGYNIVKFGSSN